MPVKINQIIFVIARWRLKLEKQTKNAEITKQNKKSNNHPSTSQANTDKNKQTFTTTKNCSLLPNTGNFPVFSCEKQLNDNKISNGNNNYGNATTLRVLLRAQLSDSGAISHFYHSSIITTNIIKSYLYICINTLYEYTT